MTCAQLAREVKLPVPTIHRLVTGKTTRPYRTSLKPIADYFSINIDQLLGNEPIPNISATELDADSIKKIPLIAWNEATTTDSKENSNQHILSTGIISSQCFALLMEDYSMEPLFPKSTILIFDSLKQALDRSYVLVKLIDKEIPTFRQLLIDVDYRYLKPLNPDLNNYKMRVLNDKDTIIACLFESRINHDQNQLTTKD